MSRNQAGGIVWRSVFIENSSYVVVESVCSRIDNEFLLTSVISLASLLVALYSRMSSSDTIDKLLSLSLGKRTSVELLPEELDR